MNSYDVQNIIPYMDIDMMILLRRMNNVFNQEIGQIKMYNFNKFVNIGDEYHGFIGLRIGSYRISKVGIRISDNLVDEQLLSACIGGHVDIVKFLMEHGATEWRYGLLYACRGGQKSDQRTDLLGFSSHQSRRENPHLEIVKLMIEKGVNDWNFGLYGACEGGNLDIVKLMVKKGANRLDFGLNDACYRGYMDIVNFLIEKRAIDWDFGLQGACAGGYLDIAKLMIKKGANDWNGGLFHACIRGHLDHVKLMIEKGATECQYCKKSMREHLLKK